VGTLYAEKGGEQVNIKARRETMLKAAGALAFAGATQWVLLVIVAQSRYPGYNTQQNYLSDLGATCHRGVDLAPCVIIGSAALIWNTTLVLLGLLSLASAVLMFSATGRRAFSILFGIWGLGALIAGLVPETLLSVHELGSLVAFLCGGIAAVLAFWLIPAPLKYFSLVLGVLALVTLIPLTFDGPFYRWNDLFGLGLGGTERMVVYPIIIWELALGAFLMSGAALAHNGRGASANKQ
jgi:hypothetical membrane protein